ncbi:MAG TPA: hypothetical protein VMX16_18820 [Terriglobia bacterium]|nr:hypothetical protein [Terriglobia bacterium]
MSEKNQEERLFEQFAAALDPGVSTTIRAPSRLRSRIYSALMLLESAQGRLRSIPATKAEGHDLCVFEELVRIAPVGDDLKSLNICRICHARLLGEVMENPPIYWGGCPYVSFKKP